MPRRRLAFAVLGAALALYIYVLVKNAWMSDDVFITLRTVDNFVHGYGLTWNPYERVQIYTHPLWMFVITLPYAIFGEGFFTILVLSFAISLGVGVIAARHWRWDAAKVAAFLILLVSSKAFIDYSSSGLENPLTHLFAVLFFSRFLRRSNDARVTERELTVALLLASLSYFNRADTVLAYAPLLLWLTWRAWPSMRLRVIRVWLVGTLPASLWTAFSTFYYGFPVPNTAFAKLAGGHYHPPLLHPHGPAYFTNSLRWDPVTLPVIATAMIIGGVAAYRRRAPSLASAVVGIGLILFYTLRIGGDYMSGRAFALPFLIGAIIIVELLPLRPQLALAGAAFAIGVIGARSPVMGRWEPSFAERDPTAITDDHSFHWTASFVSALQRHDYRIGVARQFEPPRTSLAFIWGATGFYGFQQGPARRTIDNLALSDALLARLPTRDPEHLWGRGHLIRDIPAGYLTSVETAENRIEDPSLHAYYDKLLLLTTGPLCTWKRMRTIWTMNTGGYSHYLDEYNGRR